MNEKYGREFSTKILAFRAMRGDLLAFGFEVEQSLDFVIRRFFFPIGNKESNERQVLFDDLFLKSPSASLARKVQIFRMLSQQPPFASIVPSDLLKNLERVRDLRNRFAHYPIAFDARTDENGQTLIAKLLCRDKEITLDDAFIKSLHDLFGLVSPQLRKIVETFAKNMNQNC